MENEKDFTLESVIDDLFMNKSNIVSEEDANYNDIMAITIEGYDDIMNDEISTEIDFAVESISNLKDAEMLNTLVTLKLSSLESNNDISEEGLKEVGKKIKSIIMNMIDKIGKAIANFIKKIKEFVRGGKIKEQIIVGKNNIKTIIKSTQSTYIAPQKTLSLVGSESVTKYNSILNDTNQIWNDYIGGNDSATKLTEFSDEVKAKMTKLMNDGFNKLTGVSLFENNDYIATSLIYGKGGSTMSSKVTAAEFVTKCGGATSLGDTSYLKEILNVSKVANNNLNKIKSAVKNFSEEFLAIPGVMKFINKYLSSQTSISSGINSLTLEMDKLRSQLTIILKQNSKSTSTESFFDMSDEDFDIFATEAMEDDSVSFEGIDLDSFSLEGGDEASEVKDEVKKDKQGIIKKIAAFFKKSGSVAKGIVASSKAKIKSKKKKKGEDETSEEAWKDFSPKEKFSIVMSGILFGLIFAGTSISGLGIPVAIIVGFYITAHHKDKRKQYEQIVKVELADFVKEYKKADKETKEALSRSFKAMMVTAKELRSGIMESDGGKLFLSDLDAKWGSLDSFELK